MVIVSVVLVVAFAVEVRTVQFRVAQHSCGGHGITRLGCGAVGSIFRAERFLRRVCLPFIVVIVFHDLQGVACFIRAVNSVGVQAVPIVLIDY